MEAKEAAEVRPAKITQASAARLQQRPADMLLAPVFRPPRYFDFLVGFGHHL
jgi:hypothetical protein